MRTELSVTVKVAELVDILAKNKDEHVRLNKQAWKLYRKAMREWLEARLDELEHRKPPTRQIPHPEPESHEEEYERVIGMLQMHQEDTIELTYEVYRMYVDDDWDWKHMWEVSNSYYTGRG